MITKMTKYSFILLSGEKDAFLMRLQECGVVDITRSSKPVDDYSHSLIAEAESLKSEINDITKGSDAQLASLIADEASLRKQAADLAPWGEYDRKKLAAFKISYYCIPAKKYDPSWENDYAIQKVSEADGKLWFVIVGSNKDFPCKEMPSPHTTVGEVNALIAQKELDIKDYRARLEARKVELPDLEKEVSSIYSQLNAYLASITGESAAEDALVVFEGFAPSEEDERLAKEFDSMDMYWTCEAAKEEDDPPIKLKNNKFSQMFESLTGMYGMPVYGEWDPTPILGVFFMLFFAMCMGDAGYGLILLIYGILQEKKIVNIGMFSSIGKLIAVLGAATTVVGFFLGTAFGINLTEAAWVPDSLKSLMLSGDLEVAGSSYSLQMVLAICIGVFHLCLAMGIKAVLFTKRFGFKETISSWGWLLLIVGGLVVAIAAMVGFLPADVTKILLIGIGVVSALAIYIFNKPGRNPLINIGAGLWDTYNMATGILGDVLSYIRLYALGLAGGMLGGAFNNLGSMILGDNPTWHWLPYVVILLLGHTLNLLMSSLGAFVHPLRLSFVEYFKNSGYEGKGREYNPLKK